MKELEALIRERQMQVAYELRPEVERKFTKIELRSYPAAARTSWPSFLRS